MNDFLQGLLASKGQFTVNTLNAFALTNAINQQCLSSQWLLGRADWVVFLMFLYARSRLHDITHCMSSTGALLIQFQPC